MSEELIKVLTMLERFDGRMTSVSDRLARMEGKTDALHMIVAGNGDEKSLVMRQQLVDHRLQRMEAELNEACDEIEALSTLIAAWRNRAVGAALGLSALGGAAALLGSRILEAVFGGT
jgi:hypothetical protein